VFGSQCDQMTNCPKIAPKRRPPHFSSKVMHNLLEWIK
jgi:hypothetical protein